MATSADDRPNALVDTSVAVALVVADHEHHGTVRAAVGARTLGFAGHAAYETFSVLTRLPPPVRRPPEVVSEILEASFPRSVFLSPTDARDLLRDAGRLGIAGGAIYDALVGAAAATHDLPLLTRDQRAVPTYRLLGTRFELIG